MPILDLFELLVINVFGNILLTGLGLTILFIIMGFFSRMSAPTIIIVVGTFACVYAIGYVGALAAIPLFIISLAWFSYGVLNFILNLIK